MRKLLRCVCVFSVLAVFVLGMSTVPAWAADVAVVRLWPDGSEDLSFDLDGQRVLGASIHFDSSSADARGVSVASDGTLHLGVQAQVIAAVGSAGQLASYRLSDSGDRLGGRLYSVLPFATESVEAQSRDGLGRLVVAGRAQWFFGTDSFVVARRLENGDLDLSFNGTGAATAHFSVNGVAVPSWALAVTTDSVFRPVSAGLASTATGHLFAVARHTASGALDTSFGTGGTVTVSFPGATNAWADGVAVDSAGRIVVAGRPRRARETCLPWRG